MNNNTSNIFPTSKMSDLIVADPNIITVLERLGISFGFGDQSIKEIAIHYNINLQAFISILKVFEGQIVADAILDKDAISDLLSFLKASHKYFREKQIPSVKKLISLFAEDIPPKHGNVIVSFFDGYMQEVSDHFLYEEELVFPYIDSILFNPDSNDYAIDEFEKNHTDIEQKLLDLKHILIKYIPESITSPYRTQILRELVVLERDLYYHSFIEDHILVPSIKKMEKSTKKKRN